MDVDPKRMDILSKLVFAPVYPLIARQITDKFKITQGICVDVGAGPGLLSIALAKITNLNIFILDISPGMKSVADANIEEEKLAHRIHTVVADVHDMPFADDSIDLIVSRGSIFFWEDRPTALKEIYRILKSDGVAYCGGGFGSEEVKTDVASRMITTKGLLDNERESWGRRVNKNLRKVTVQEFRDELIRANVPGTVALENAGVWVQIHKGRST